MLRPHDRKSVEFEAGYIRHLEWHPQARDPWAWYGWSIWAGERYRWFVYATFGHSAASLDSAVAPAEDERDNVLNVAPHVEWMENGLYEYLPGLSRGTGEPKPTARLEFTRVDAGARRGPGVRGGARRGPAGAGGRDALVPDGGGRRRAALRAAASAAEPGGDLLAGAATRSCPTGSRAWSRR